SITAANSGVRRHPPNNSLAGVFQAIFYSNINFLLSIPSREDITYPICAFNLQQKETDVKRYLVFAAALGLSSILCAQTYNISTIGGNVTRANGDGVNVSAAPMLNPHQIAIDSAGNIYIADTDAHRVRKIDANGLMTVIAGQGRPTGSGDTAGPGISTPLN